MARPEKHEYEKRSQQVKIRLTIAEQEHLRDQANHASLPLAEYVRRRSVGHTISSSRQKFDPALVTKLNNCILELRAWGNNINQIARNLNSGREERLGWEDAQAETQRLISRAETVLEGLVENHGA